MQTPTWRLTTNIKGLPWPLSLEKEAIGSSSMLRQTIISLVASCAMAAGQLACVDQIDVQMVTSLIFHPMVISADITEPVTWTINDQVTVTCSSSTNLLLTTTSTQTVIETITLCVMISSHG